MIWTLVSCCLLICLLPYQSSGIEDIEPDLGLPSLEELPDLEEELTTGKGKGKGKGRIIRNNERRLRRLFNKDSDGNPSDELTEILLRCKEGILGDVQELSALLKELTESAGEETKPFDKLQGFFRADNIATQSGLAQDIIECAIAEIVKSFEDTLDREAILNIVFGMPILALNSETFEAEGNITIPKDFRICPFTPKVDCSRVPDLEEFRTIDGSCNNLDNPLQGRSFTPFSRILPPAYNDSVSEPRADADGNPLPNARLVSSTISPHMDRPNNIASRFFMIWGQFTDHDLTLTPFSSVPTFENGESELIQCGSDGCDASIAECLPIMIPARESFFTADTPCLPLVRSEGVPDVSCAAGPRQQINQITHFMDGSNVYGSTKEELEHLRDGESPFMRTSPHPFDQTLMELLPTVDDNPECEETTDIIRCFEAGDERVNEQNMLSIIHTVLIREHNRIATELLRLNKIGRSNETLFQLTRKIVGAQLQHITYNEFLAMALGSEEHRVELGVNLLTNNFFEGYDDELDISVSTEFASVAFRFGHSLLPQIVKRAQVSRRRGKGGITNPTITEVEDLFLSETFFRPNAIYNNTEGGVDAFINGMVLSPSQDVDRFLTEEVTQHLFTLEPPEGMGSDLNALNIQRAREHGIPGYNDFREFCGIGRVTDFTQLGKVFNNPKVAQLFEKVFTNVDDIDPFVALIAEPPVEDAIVGQTLQCILGQEFRRVRFADRFWYERRLPEGFSFAQLKEIRKASLARMLCDNSDNIEVLPARAMEQPTFLRPKLLRRPANPLVRCDDTEAIPVVDLKVF